MTNFWEQNLILFFYFGNYELRGAFVPVRHPIKFRYSATFPGLGIFCPEGRTNLFNLKAQLPPQMKELLSLIDKENLLEVIRTEAPIARMSHLLSLELISIEKDKLLLTPKGRDLLRNN